MGVARCYLRSASRSGGYGLGDSGQRDELGVALDRLERAGAVAGDEQERVVGEMLEHSGFHRVLIDSLGRGRFAPVGAVFLGEPS